MLEPITAAALIEPAVKRTVDGLFSKLSSAAGRLATSVGSQLKVDLRIGFQNYFSVSYSKCKHYKSILTPERPLELLSNYVHITLSMGAQSQTDDEIINKILDIKYLVISGLAGGGKSMFMKYLTMRFFEESRGLAPLFVELRNINSFSQPDLLTYIRVSATGTGSGITQSQFELSLTAGALLLILDGFDEVNHSHRDQIQEQILSLQKNFPETPVVVSSRPNDRFGSWQSFYILSVDRLTKAQCLELIKGLDYDEGVKKRFGRQVETALYKSHMSFLSSPLLTTIMLLTYQNYAEIPAKMHSFYGQAFDTLFQKHDAQKEQYQRSTQTGLSREEFKSCFAAFSAFSYAKERISFDETALADTAKQAIKYVQQSNSSFKAGVTPSQFIGDLREAVCMIHKDGLDTTYVHRSFQEYFAALFLTNLTGNLMKDMCNLYSIRWGDSVLPMARDMASDSIELNWVLPAIKKILEVLFPVDDAISSAHVFTNLFKEVTVLRDGDDLYWGASNIVSGIVGPLESLARIYPECITPTSLLDPLKNVIISDVRRHFVGVADQLKFRELEWKKFFRKSGKKDRGSPVTAQIRIEVEDKDEWWLNLLGYQEFYENIKTGLKKMEKDVSHRARNRDDILGKLLLTDD